MSKLKITLCHMHSIPLFIDWSYGWVEWGSRQRIILVSDVGNYKKKL